jgi:hypothetical protein
VRCCILAKPQAGQGACTRVKQCEENQTKKISLFCLKNSLYPIGAMLLTPNKIQTNPNKSKQIHTNSYKTHTNPNMFG